MKNQKIIALILAMVMTMAVAAGCNAGPEDKKTPEDAAQVQTTTAETEAATEEKTEEVTTEQTQKHTTIKPNTPVYKKLDSAKYRLEINSNPIYGDVEFNKISESGGAVSYEDMVHNYPMVFENVNFVKFEIVGVYTAEEAMKITGEWYFENITTLYKAVLTYDYLNQKPLNIKVNLGKAGTATTQFEGRPSYMIGETYIDNLIWDGGDNPNRVASGGVFTFSFHTIKGIDFAYKIGFDYIKLSDSRFPNLDMEMFPEEKSVVTSTKNNPAQYTQKSVVDELAAFFKEDWKANGFKFYNFDNFKPSEVQ